MVGREQNTGAKTYPQNRILCSHFFPPPTKDSTYSISSYGRSLNNQSGNSEGWDKCIGDHAVQAGNMYSISNPGN